MLARIRILVVSIDRVSELGLFSKEVISAGLYIERDLRACDSLALQLSLVEYLLKESDE
jgi:hypothetical protein